ncbi:hypothetical protein BV25DRAFT_1129405 [Artomyces pyxidatus]|uniref:Uncharacterized protein n=1 Tax=Artomyces pyxidatus TaxID=48021 RepID=A0ACB8STI7_9AGAM|nr:hypothetical protein BV25DRAFT_1129405 [Artomyces pyxidatus]
MITTNVNGFVSHILCTVRYEWIRCMYVLHIVERREAKSNPLRRPDRFASVQSPAKYLRSGEARLRGSEGDTPGDTCGHKIITRSPPLQRSTRSNSRNGSQEGTGFEPGIMLGTPTNCSACETGQVPTVMHLTRPSSPTFLGCRCPTQGNTSGALPCLPQPSDKHVSPVRTTD